MTPDPIATAIDAGSIRLVPKLAPGPEPKRIAAGQGEPHALAIIAAACMIAFHIAALLTGLLAAWVYYWRN